MATEFDDDTHYGLFFGGGALTSGTSFKVRQSELTLAAMRAAGLFGNMVDGTSPPTTDKLWLDKNTDPAVLKEWDSIGSAWMPMTFERVFERAAATVLAVTGGTANNIVVNEPSIFISNRLYSVSPSSANSGATTITVTGVGTFPVRYLDGTPIVANELAQNRPSMFVFRNGGFDLLNGYSAQAAAEAARDEAIAAASNTQVELDSRAYAISSYHPIFAPNKIRVAGYALAGDGGAALYAKEGSEPSHAGKFSITLADGVTVVWYGAVGNRLPVEAFGAKADNTGASDGTDNAAAIQAAINTLSAKLFGGVAILGAGRYLCGALSIPTNVKLVGDGRGVTILNPGNTVATAWISFEGTFGAETNISGNYSRGAKALATSTAHGLAINDIILMKSQRDANSADAGSLWQLGADNQALYFGEFLAIQSVESTSAFTSASPVIFPSYRDNATAETSPTARPSSTISKLTPCRNADLEDMTLLNGPNVSALVRGTGAVNCHVRRVDFELGTMTGYSCVWRHSLDSYAEGCVARHDAGVDYTGNFFNYNDFLVAGSQNSGFRLCGSILGSQAFDITFETNGIPHVNCFLDGCWTLWNKWNPATTHPGGYGTRVTGCRFLQNARSGVAIRSRAAIVTGNHITAALAAVTDSYGLSLREGWARDSLVADNYIDGFEKGITLHDSGSDASGNRNFEKFEVVIKDNVIKNVGYGVWRVKSASNTATTNTGLVLSGNHIQASITAIDIDGAHGITVEGNTIRGALSARGIRLQNANDLVVSENTFDDIGAGILSIVIASTCLRWACLDNVIRGSGELPSTPSTGSSALVWKNNVGTASIYLENGTAISFPIPSNHAVVMVSGFRAAMNGAAACQSAAVEKMYGNAAFAASTSVLTGTTGTAGNVTVSVTGGRVYVENQSGQPETMGLTVMASAA